MLEQIEGKKKLLDILSAKFILYLPILCDGSSVDMPLRQRAFLREVLSNYLHDR